MKDFDKIKNKAENGYKRTCWESLQTQQFEQNQSQDPCDTSL